MSEISREDNVDENSNKLSKDKGIEEIDSPEEGDSVKSPFRQILDSLLNDGNRKSLIEMISAICSLSTFVIYIVSTYYPKEKFEMLDYIDYAVCSYYNAEYLLNLYLAQHRLLFMISVNNIVDLITSLPPYMAGINNLVMKKIIELSRILRIIRLARYITKHFKYNENEVTKHISIMIISALTLILIFTLIFRLVEIDRINYIIMNPDYENLSLVNQSQFHDFLYYIVVTLSTVGYGDIFPITELGRFVIIMLIILTLYLIPSQTNELIKLMSITSVYSRAGYKANIEVPHIVICGHVSVDALKNFCYELFHPDHGTQDKNAIIIQNNLPSQDMKVFLHTGVYEVALKYLQGNPILEKDLKRADILNAKACVIMTDKYTTDPHSVDHTNILLSLAIKKFFLYENRDSQLYIQLIKPENKIHYQSGLQSLSLKNFNVDQVIIIEEIKMNLLSKSCLIPGIIAMTSNLVISAGSSEEDESPSMWLSEYSEGRGHEIYRTLLNDSLKNKSFSKLSAEIYQKHNAIVFALEIEVEGKTLIRLNPGNFFIEKLVDERDDVKIFIYIICSDKVVADKIETDGLEHNEIKEKKVLSQTKYDNYMKLNIKDTQQIDENIDPSNEQAEEEDDYFIIKENINFNVDIKKDSIRNSDIINKHIIICGTHPSLYYFILPLRAKYLGEENLKWVVILANDISKEWDSISRFEKIIYINGSPLNTEDLYRANIEYADKAVVLECENKVYSNYEEEMIDSESVFIYKAIKKCNQNIQIMTELVYDSNIEFLLPKNELSSLLKNENSRIQYESTSLFAAGEVYISSIIDTLTCQAYYNPHIVTILYQLLTGGKNTSNVTMRGICENVGLRSSNLWQIPIHENFINKTFLELFTDLAENHNCIALGIYRLPGAKDNDHPYVYTNPTPETRLTHRDKIFVLAIDSVPWSINYNKNIEGNSVEKEEKNNNNIFVDSISVEDMNNKSNKITPFRYLDDTLTEIENYINYLEKNLRSLKFAVKETIGNAVKQEFSSLIN